MQKKTKYQKTSYNANTRSWLRSSVFAKIAFWVAETRKSWRCAGRALGEVVLIDWDEAELQLRNMATSTKSMKGRCTCFERLAVLGRAQTFFQRNCNSFHTIINEFSREHVCTHIMTPACKIKLSKISFSYSILYSCAEISIHFAVH